MGSFFRFVKKTERLGIISLAHAPVHVTDFPVVNVHVDKLSSAPIWQHKLCATFSANVNVIHIHAFCIWSAAVEIYSIDILTSLSISKSGRATAKHYWLKRNIVWHLWGIILIFHYATSSCLSYLRYLCLFVHSDVQHILCSDFRSVCLRLVSSITYVCLRLVSSITYVCLRRVSSITYVCLRLVSSITYVCLRLVSSPVASFSRLSSLFCIRWRSWYI